MSREVTSRDVVILGGFIVLLIIGSYAYIRLATAPTNTPTPRLSSSKANRADRMKAVTKEKLKASSFIKFPTQLEKKRDYKIIAERNIFQKPAPKKEEKPKTQPSEPLLPLQPPPPIESNPPPPQPPRYLTATGIMKIGEETYVLMENLQTRETALVKVGDTAFGYKVASVGENLVEIQQSDFSHRIELGQGKSERRMIASGRVPITRPSPTPLDGDETGTPHNPPPFNPSPSPMRPSFPGNPDDWTQRMIERWNRMPESVRNRILTRIGQIWQQLSPQAQQAIIRRFSEMGINFNPTSQN